MNECKCFPIAQHKFQEHHHRHLIDRGTLIEQKKANGKPEKKQKKNMFFSTQHTCSN
jgi:hypothetical protein